jgi:hypothetical protein
MTLLTISIIITVGFFFIYYIRTTKKEDRWKFQSISNLLQTIFVFITLEITIYVIIGSNEDMSKLFDKLEGFYNKMSRMDTSLMKTSDRLSKLPGQLDTLSISVKDLNNVVNAQKEGFERNTSQLNNSVGSLTSSINEYEKNIKDYSSQLNKIVSATDKQLIIWEKQQEIVKKEYERRPKFIFTISCHENNNKIYFSSINITNEGNIDAELISFSIFLPKKLFYITDKGFFSKEYENEMEYKYQIIESYILIPDIVRVFKIDGFIDNLKDNELDVLCMISYRSTYESKSIKGYIKIDCFEPVKSKSKRSNK